MTAKRKSLWVAERLVPGELSVFPYEEGLSRGAKLFDNFHITKAERLSPQNGHFAQFFAHRSCQQRAAAHRRWRGRRQRYERCWKRCAHDPPASQRASVFVPDAMRHAQELRRVARTGLGGRSKPAKPANGIKAGH